MNCILQFLGIGTALFSSHQSRGCREQDCLLRRIPFLIANNGLVFWLSNLCASARLPVGPGLLARPLLLLQATATLHSAHRFSLR